MDSQALRVSERLDVVAIEPTDIIIFHMPTDVADKYYSDTRKLFVKKSKTVGIIPNEVLFLPECIKMTVIKQIKKP